ncbi:MAG: hypothetical protein UX27_C0023G0005 [Candidatus Azambacteria bacterium GW2011_GWA2_45_90]|uniref:O-antigen polymerase n=1 Tax=Candidatus Azambacteria bacterium GW2011_GWA2_45_90 TaxID=1618614 RepID=A0A0G1NCB1_9BACT|nr:MAG: hypothetical protein UX27_C0023G0005 [Candidatus Azambacteria bacterium GW2011_GWA2_45_90]
MLSLEKYLFYLLVFSLPFQTRLILFQWGSSSSFGTSGGFNEYQAAFFYFTDFLIALIFISCLWRAIRTGSFGWRSIFASHSDFLLAAFVIIAGVSLYWANNFGLGVYQFLKLAEFVWLFFYVKNNFAVLNLSHALWFLFSSAVFQALLADWQWHNQSSIGLKLLGESVLDPNLAGVAKLDIPNAKLIRPYGTFPHPNILAAFLSAAIFIFYWLYLSNKKPYGRIQISEWLKFLAFFILLLGLFLTFSRLIIITFILAGVIFFWLSKRLGKDDLIFKQRRQVLLYLSAIFTFIFLFLMRPEMFGRLHKSNGRIPALRDVFGKLGDSAGSQHLSADCRRDRRHRPFLLFMVFDKHCHKNYRLAPAELYSGAADPAFNHARLSIHRPF